MLMNNSRTNCTSIMILYIKILKQFLCLSTCTLIYISITDVTDHGSCDSLQDLLRCHYCETPNPPKHCDICQMHICDVCEEKHQSGESKEHYIVPFKMRGLTPKCKKHSTKICELFCEYCGVPICAECASSTEHERHKKETFIKLYSLKEELILRDLQELEDIIYPSYKEVASNIPGQRADLDKHSQKLKISLNNKAETLHRGINSIIHKTHADIDAMNSEHLIAINKQETAIKQTIKDISQFILEVRRLLDTNDVHLVFKYQSKIHKFKILPTQLHVTLPSFEPTENDSEQISKQIGSLSKLESTWRPISTAYLEKQRILTRRRAFYGFVTLNSMCCLSDTEFLTCQNDDNMLRLYNLQGELIKYIKTKSWRTPRSIDVTRSGDLVYTGQSYKSINLLRGTKIQTLIRLRGWRALNVCCKSAGELLLIMYIYNKEEGQCETKVVRCCGSTVKQTIQ